MTENPEEKRLEFPIQGHDKCPHCGCADGIGQTKIAELKKDGLLEEHMFPRGPTWSMTLIDQTKPIMVSPLSITKPKIPVLNIYWDICANPDCLAVYVTGAEFIMQEIELPKMPVGLGGGRQFPTGFPFGKP